jgi:hypothetical protein
VIKRNSKIVCAIYVVSVTIAISGCKQKLSGLGPEYYTTAFQCDMKHSDTGWCFATPTTVYTSNYVRVGKGTVQDYIVPNGKMCVANTEGCMRVTVEIKDRK